MTNKITFHDAAGLERTRRVAEALGVTRPAKHVVTITGTNGKGSTASLCETIALSAGMSVGVFTTPHIYKYNESFRINGEDIDDRSMLKALHRVACVSRGQDPATVPLDMSIFGGQRSVKDACLGGADPKIPLHPYELLALVALVLINESQVDVAILEVGIGGRWDAVNVVDADVAIVTAVDIDHCEYLGPDRETIGRSKAGIFRANGVVVLGELDPPASVLEEAAQLGCRVLRNGEGFSTEPSGDGWLLHWPDQSLRLPPPAMPAPIQITNGAVAATALRAIHPGLRESEIADAIAVARAPGRLEKVAHAFADVFVDVAHNPHAAKEIAAWIDQKSKWRRVLAVFGTYNDKDVSGIVAELQGRVSQWFLCGLQDFNRRGFTADQLREAIASQVHVESIQLFETVGPGFKAACEQAQEGDLVLVFGAPPMLAVAMAG
ncbi:bifunctional folylpolyglutamate synthase/dihydrofolate synthase [Stenotrophomonas pavanii]|uniref:bifunctional folylpolyglutamate synthase/dihydrofolate synthase n=1 Tax=Stenotrophomonas pavanii TaxID=487698 RepID=UPI0013104666